MWHDFLWPALHRTRQNHLKQHEGRVREASEQLTVPNTRTEIYRLTRDMKAVNDYLWHKSLKTSERHMYAAVRKASPARPRRSRRRAGRRAPRVPPK